MLVTRTSIISGKTRTKDIDCTEEEMARWICQHLQAQDAFPHLPKSDREFIMTGITDDEWDATFKEEEDV